MSDLDEVPALSPEAKAFLDKHANTGEPSADEFDAARNRFLAPGRPLPTAAAPAAPKRTWSLRHEVLAAAAVLLVLVGAQGLYLAFHTAAPTQSTELKAVVEAYRAGDLEGAHRLASQNCSADACKPLASSLSRALGLANRFESLSPAELEQLAALDTQLSEGTETTLALRIAQRRMPKVKPEVLPPAGEALATAEQLFKEAVAQKTAHNLEQAVLRLEKCVLVAPGYHPCYRLLGSVFAMIASRDQSAADMERARKYYQLFLEVAPPDDEYVPKVRAILEAARENDAPLPQRDQPVLSLGGTLPTPAPREAAPSEVHAVQATFKDGSGPVALAMAERCAPFSPHCQSLADDIKEFEAKSQHLEKLDETNLIILYELQLKISGGSPSTRAAPIREQIVSRLSVKAEQAKATGNWVRAIELANRVLRYDRQHLGAQALLAEARTQAREVYLRGYQLKDSHPEEAIRLFKEVMTMTPPDDDNHQKAKSRVNELQALVANGTPAEEATEDRPGDVVVPLHGTIDVNFTQDIQRVALGDPNVADVSVIGPRSLRVKGVNRGKTTLLTWLVSGQRESRLIEVR